MGAREYVVHDLFALILREASMSTAKSVIEIWLWGGPSQLETFDPKPNASADYNNGLKSIPTNVKGMEIHQ